MKRNSMIKAIIITFLAYVVLSWIIPGGAFSSGVFTKGSTTPVGIGDIFIYPISTSITSIFVLTGLIILLIGGLYGVMNKTGVYTKMVSGTAKKFNGKEKTFLVISIIVFAILSSLTTLTLPLLIIVPFFIAVILTLGFNKMTALLSTVGAILVGNMGTIFGYNVGGYSYINYFFGLKTTENIAYKIALFVLLVIVLLIFVIKTSKIDKKETKKGRKSKKEEETKEELVIPLYKKVEESKKSVVPLVIVLSITMVLLLVAMFNWAGAIGVEKTIFDTWHTNITNVKLNGYSLFANLLGSINPFGYWTNYELAMVLIIAIILIGAIYNLKVKETFDAMLDGMKEMLKVAAVVILANVLLLVVNSASQTFFTTIFNALFSMSKGLNFVTMSLISAIGSIAYSDFPYLMNALYDPVTNLYSSNYAIAVFIMQAIYGFVMLLVPTSFGLVFGLEYLNISYKEWFKQNWRLLLSLLLTALVVIIVMMLV